MNYKFECISSIPNSMHTSPYRSKSDAEDSIVEHARIIQIRSLI